MRGEFGFSFLTFFGVTLESRFISELRWNSHTQHRRSWQRRMGVEPTGDRSEEHTSELQSHLNLVCRLLLEKKKLSNAKARHAGRLRPPSIFQLSVNYF